MKDEPRSHDTTDSRGPSNHELDKRIALMEAAVERLADDLGAINANISRLVWAVVLVLVGGVAQFVLSGGLHQYKPPQQNVEEQK